MGILDIFRGQKKDNTFLESLINSLDNHYYWGPIELDSEQGEKLKGMSREEQCAFIMDIVAYSGGFAAGDDTRRRNDRCRQIVSHLLRKQLPFDHDQLLTLLKWIPAKRYESSVPLGYTIKQIEFYLRSHSLSSELIKQIKIVADRAAGRGHGYYDSAANRANQISRLRELTGAPDEDLDLNLEANWAAAAEIYINELVIDKRRAWVKLLLHARSASGGKPTKKWLKQGSEHLKTLDKAQFSNVLNEWFRLYCQQYNRLTNTHNLSDYDRYMRAKSAANMLKGLVWLCTPYADLELTRTITKMAITAYRKIPQVGPQDVALGNACVWALGNIPGLDAIGQLAVLKLRVKFGTAQKGIEKALVMAAKREGVTKEEIEEMSVPTYGLTDVGVLEQPFDEYTAVLTILGSSSTQLQWRKPDGTLQKSIPKFVKDRYSSEVKVLKQQAKDIQKMLPAQRDRIENLYLSQKRWEYAIWLERYINHPLVGAISRRLLWRFAQDGRLVTGVWQADQFVDLAGDPIELDGEQTTVTLWHPLDESTEAVLAWRRFFELHQIQQPFKQAHREIYVVTPPELQTELYSNRFAAHILRQHQFNSLCAVRGWRNKLRLMVDDEYPPAMRDLPEWGLRAEFWIEGAGDEYGRDTTEVGTYLFVATDQVRFYAAGSPQNSAHAGGGGYRTFRRNDDEVNPLPVAEIPPLVFSEIMRDVDLFVGVGSIGNDPNWIDGGSEGRYTDYWQGYSFGELSATAETRKEVLGNLLPKLKIGSQCMMAGRFLEVTGQLRTYKIHLGSGNILMEPNDQYLCIVPGQNSRVKQSQDVFLPFEGDRTLSIILSKALMLANDSKIKDATITRQIKRK